MIELHCKCGNASRYINERGDLCCGICPLKEGIDSIKLTDVPKLLAWSRVYLAETRHVSCSPNDIETLIAALRDIVQRLPEPRP